MIPSRPSARFHPSTFRLIFNSPSATILRSTRIGASLQFDTRGGKVPSGVANS